MVKHDAVRGMPGRVNDPELMGADSDDFPVFQPAGAFKKIRFLAKRIFE